MILGGDGKGQDFTPLAQPVQRFVRAVVLIGRDAPAIQAVLQDGGVPLLSAASMEEAVTLAAQQAQSGDAVLMFETGHFASLWNKLATRLGLKSEFLGLPGVEGWRQGVKADMIETRLKADTAHSIKAVCVVHNETSTGVTSDIAAVRRAIDNAKHPALLMVDTISGLASADYRHDEWGRDAGDQQNRLLSLHPQHQPDVRLE